MDNQMTNAMFFLTDAGNIADSTNCSLQILKNLKTNEKDAFIAGLNNYERIGLMACYKICIGKLTEMEN